MVRILHIFNSLVFIKGQALGKMTTCENDFAWLSLIKQVQFQTLCPAVKNSCLPTDNVNETLAS